MIVPLAQGARRPLLLLALAVALLTLLTVLMAAHLPWFGAVLESSADGRVVRVAGGTAGLPAGVEITALEGAGERFVLRGEMFRPSPGTVSSYTATRALYADQGRLCELLTAVPEVTAYAADGTAYVLPVNRRGVADLPLVFWVQLAAALLAISVAASMLAFRADDPAVRYFALTGICYFFGMLLNAMYSTRPVCMPESSLLVFFELARLCVTLYFASFLAVLWHFPVALGSPRVPLVFFAFFATVKVIDGLHWIDSVTLAYRLPLLAGVGLGICLAWHQWRRASGDPLHRAMLRWFILFQTVAVGIYGISTLWVIAKGEFPVHIGYLLTLVGLAHLGTVWVVARYPLFNLERWWVEVWAWFLGGLLIVLCDFTLAYFIGHGALSLTLALALCGWLYFPLRQMVLGRLAKDRRQRVDKLFPRIIEILFRSRPDSVDGAARELLAEAFGPVATDRQEADGGVCRVTDGGRGLYVPAIEAGGAYVLRHAAGGARLFSARDADVAQAMMELLRVGHSRRQAYLQGQAIERERIAHDLHDDIGARLLTLIHRARCPEDAELARAALQDLRTLLASLDGRAQPLGEVLADCRAEAEIRCEAAELSLAWQDAAVPLHDVLLAPASRVAIQRILREALSNAIRHAGARRLTVTVAREGAGLRIAVADDGRGLAPELWRSGRGSIGMERRACDAGGRIQYSTVPGEGTTVALIIDTLEAV